MVSGYELVFGGINSAATGLWNGHSWIYPPFAKKTGTTDDMMVMGIGKLGADLIFAMLFDGDLNTAYLNTVTNNGTARAYPRFVVKRDGGTAAIVKYLENFSTGKRIWFNYDLQDGEELAVNFDPQNSECKSSYWGDRWDAILRGSDVADFYLLPGVNNVSVFVDSTTDCTVTSYLQWRNAYESADGAST